MKKLMFVLSLLVVFMPMAQADSKTDKLIDGLLGIGARALQAEQERRAEAAQQQDETEAVVEDEASEPKKRTWRDRGRDMVGTLVTGTVGGLGDKPLSLVLAETVKKAVDTLIHEYKEQYKQEGREYAKEVGDKIVGRVLSDPKIERSIFSLQALCWGIVVYLTLVTLAMVFGILHLKRSYVKLLAAVEKMTSKIEAQSSRSEE